MHSNDKSLRSHSNWRSNYKLSFIFIKKYVARKFFIIYQSSWIFYIVLALIACWCYYEFLERLLHWLWLSYVKSAFYSSIPHWIKIFWRTFNLYCKESVNRNVWHRQIVSSIALQYYLIEAFIMTIVCLDLHLVIFIIILNEWRQGWISKQSKFIGEWFALWHWDSPFKQLLALSWVHNLVIKIWLLNRSYNVIGAHIDNIDCGIEDFFVAGNLSPPARDLELVKAYFFIISCLNIY